MSQIHETPDPNATYRTPRWVKVFGIIVIALVLLVAVMLVTGIGGEHGPGRHAPSGDTPAASVTEAYTPPMSHGG